MRIVKKVVAWAYFFVRIRQLLLTFDTIEIFSSFYSSLRNKISTVSKVNKIRRIQAKNMPMSQL